MGGRLDEVFSMVSYKSRRAEDAKMKTYIIYALAGSQHQSIIYL